MRIVTGSARGITLQTLEGEATRPTPSAVKEAILLLIDAEVDFDENCFELLQKKYAPLPKDKKERQKIVASMMRYGYTLSQIKYAMVR